MSRRFVNTFPCFEALDSSVEQKSALTNVGPFDSASYQVKFSAPSSGEFHVQARNGKYRPDQDETDWVDLDFGPSGLVITSETDVRILLVDLTFTELRLVWSPSASTGTINSTLTAKAVGA